MTSSLQQLLDRQAIVDCLLRYTRGVDRFDVDLIRSAFHNDSTGFRGGPGGSIVPSSVDEFLANWLPKQEERHVVQHYCTNYAIEIDGVSAHVESYWLVVLRLHGSDVGEVMGGRFTDRFEQRSGEWRISTRVVIQEWSGTVNLSPLSAVGEKTHFGRRDRSDPSYARPLDGVQ